MGTYAHSVGRVIVCFLDRAAYGSRLWLTSSQLPGVTQRNPNASPAEAAILAPPRFRLAECVSCKEPLKRNSR